MGLYPEPAHMPFSFEYFSTKLISLVRIDNNASKKLFEKNDYELKLNWFEKELS